MPSESSNYIAELNINNPVGSQDAANLIDEFIRNTKRAVYQTLPNLAGEVSLSQGEMNYLRSATSNIQTQLNALKTGKLDISSTAVYSQSAGAASSAVFATSASNAASAGYAFSANNAASAVGAQSAQFATSATNATNAVNATSAVYAFSATNATSAFNAHSAVFAASATNATNAASATNATSAVYAASATNATNAASATSATSARFAASASFAYSAQAAIYANSAGNSADSVLLNGQGGSFYRSASNLNAGTIANARLGSNSIGASGYQYLGSLLMQWGTSSSVASGGTTSVSFPTTFAAVYAVVAAGQTATSINGGEAIYNISTSGFTFYNGKSGNTVLQYLAIGA